MCLNVLSVFGRVWEVFSGVKGCFECVFDVFSVFWSCWVSFVGCKIWKNEGIDVLDLVLIGITIGKTRKCTGVRKEVWKKK